MPPLRSRRRAPVLAAAVAATFAVGGCGSSGSDGDGDADPAQAIPPSAVAYVEALIAPDGDQAAGSLAAIQKLLGVDDPGAAIVEAFDDDGSADYARDFEPWLGDRIGVGVTGITDDEPLILLSLTATDTDVALESIDRVQGDPAATRTHNDVEYRVYRDDAAVAVVDELVLVGDEPALRAGIDASKGDALADGEPIAAAREAVDQEAVGFGFINPRPAIDLLLSAAEIPAPLEDSVRDALGGSGLEAAAVALDLEADAARLDLAAVGVAGAAGGAGAAGDPAATLAGLPGGSSVGVGLGDIGAQIEQIIAQLGAAGGVGGISPEQLIAGLGAQLGIDIRQDLLSWMGEGAIFVQGQNLREIGGGLIVQSKDPAASRRSIGAIERLAEQFLPPNAVRREGDGLEITLPILPLPLNVVASEDRFIIALGDAALRSALRPDGRLDDDERFQDATGRLDDGVAPQVYADVAQLVTLVSALLAGDPTFDRIRPYLESLGALVAGGGRDGETVRAQVVLGLE